MMAGAEHYGETCAMDNRLYFVLGDLLANISIGALIGALAVGLIGTGWNIAIQAASESKRLFDSKVTNC